MFCFNRFRQKGQLDGAALVAPAARSEKIRSPMPRFPVLDGWRGISILAVLACHMLPLGPRSWRLNEAVGLLGMSLFFTLSGFLITKTLIHDPSIRNFSIRRFFRIIPLAWLFAVLVLPLVKAPAADYGVTLLFLANLPPYHLTPLTGHYWSLCVEVQFYAFVAVLFWLAGNRGLITLVVIGLLVTGNRMMHGVGAAISTPYRSDEIFSGATLALVHSDYLGSIGRCLRRALATASPAIIVAPFLLACHPSVIIAEYFRPYLAAALVGTTLLHGGILTNWLQHRKLAYVGEISYALYVIHPLSLRGWLGHGTTVIKYAKRPLCIAISFLAAHFSTRYYEKRWISLGRRLIARTPSGVESGKELRSTPIYSTS